MVQYDKFVEILKRNIISVAIPKVTDVIINRLLDRFDEKLGGKVPLEDPTAPENIKDAYRESLVKSVEESLRVSDDIISFSVGDKDDLGYSGVSTPLSTLVFALEGFLDKYAFIPATVVKQRFAKSRKIGRYDRGYLVSKSSFEKNNWDMYISWEEARLKYTPEEAVNIFDIDVSEEIDTIFSDVIRKSIIEFLANLKAK